MVVNAPERSLEQRRDALKKGNDVRVKRAKLKQDVAGGRKKFTAIVMDPPAFVETMKLWDLMINLPKVGRVKVNKALTQARISPSKTVGGLSERQRSEICELMRYR